MLDEKIKRQIEEKTKELLENVRKYSEVYNNIERFVKTIEDKIQKYFGNNTTFHQINETNFRCLSNISSSENFRIRCDVYIDIELLTLQGLYASTLYTVENNIINFKFYLERRWEEDEDDEYSDSYWMFDTINGKYEWIIQYSQYNDKVKHVQKILPYDIKAELKEEECIAIYKSFAEFINSFDEK